VETGMERILNSAILPFVNQGKLSMRKVNELIELKSFIDRNVSRKYLTEGTPEALFEKYGVYPDVVTWGDFFQTELGADAVKYSDDEFVSVCDTVKFDIMSSYRIFSDQKAEFFEWVESYGSEIITSGAEKYTEEESEILHLKILKDYYLNMGIMDNFTPEEMLWYNSFGENKAAALA